MVVTQAVITRWLCELQLANATIISYDFLINFFQI